MKPVLYLLLTLTSLYTYSQNSIIKGFAFSLADSTTLPFCNVSLVDTNNNVCSGTTTGIDGDTLLGLLSL